MIEIPKSKAIPENYMGIIESLNRNTSVEFPYQTSGKVKIQIGIRQDSNFQHDFEINLVEILVVIIKDKYR